MDNQENNNIIRNSKGQFIKGAMPRLGIKLSESHKKRLSELMKGDTRGFKKGHGKLSNGSTGKTWKLSDIAKKNMSISKIGIKFSTEHIKHLKETKIGKKQSAETIEKRVQKLRGRKRTEESKLKTSGKNNYRWISDRTKLKKSNRRGDSAYFEWVRNIYKRDRWKCRIADENCKGRIEAHHILRWNDFPELRYEINNGITLCHFHHPRKRVEEKQLSPYFQDLVNK